MEEKSKYAAQMRYAAKAIVKVYLDLYRKSDGDIIEWLDAQGNRTKAIKAAIREHIQRHDT